jgi:hypothetical protein
MSGSAHRAFGALNRDPDCFDRSIFPHGQIARVCPVPMETMITAAFRTMILQAAPFLHDCLLVISMRQMIVNNHCFRHFSSLFSRIWYQKNFDVVTGVPISLYRHAKKI